MNEIDTLNGFFARFDLSDIELKLKSTCQDAKTKLDTASAELQAKRQELFQKEEEVKALTYRMEGLLQFILEVEKDRLSKSSAKIAQG
jgi:hypothetical protein